MCTGAEGLLIASLLSTAAGTAASADAGRRQKHARMDAADLERTHREELTKKAQGLFSEELGKSDPKLATTTADEAGADELAKTQALIDRPGGFGTPTQAITAADG